MIGAKHYKTHSRYFSWKVKRSKTRQKAAWHSVSLALTSEIAGKHRVLPKLFHTDFMLVYFITFDLPCESSLIESKYGEERTCRTCPSFATFLVSIYDTAREKNTYNLQDASCEPQVCQQQLRAQDRSWPQQQATKSLTKAKWLASRPWRVHFATETLSIRNLITAYSFSRGLEILNAGDYCSKCNRI